MIAYRFLSPAEEELTIYSYKNKSKRSYCDGIV